MNKNLMQSRGFTLIEITLALAIMLILGGIGVYAFINARNIKELEVTTESIASKLNEARSNSMAGKNRESFGIKFNTASYVYFKGAAYDPAEAENVVYDLPNGINISTTLANPDQDIIFARLTGLPDEAATVTVSRTNDASMVRNIIIGPQGEISVLK